MEQIDLKKKWKELYSSSAREVAIVDVPKMSFLSIDGAGDPNTSQEYQEAVETLFSVSYAIKFIVKKSSEAIDYAVMPLEGLWWVDDMSKFSIKNKNAWQWTAMIMQPDFVSEELVKKATDQAGKKKKLPALAKLRFQSFHEGLSAQIMHIGPYAEEPPTIEKLHGFIESNGYRMNGKHHEIYLSDPRKAAPEKMKTVIRQPIR